MDPFKHKKGLKSQKIFQTGAGITSGRAKKLRSYSDEEKEEVKDPQEGVSGYMKSGRSTYKKLDEAGNI